MTYGPELTCIVAWVRCVVSVMACGYLRHLQGHACAMKNKNAKTNEWSCVLAFFTKDFWKTQRT